MTTQSASKLQPLIIRRIKPGDKVLLRPSVLIPDQPESDILLKDDDCGYHYGAFLVLKDSSKLVAVVSVFYDTVSQNDTPPQTDTSPQTDALLQTDVDALPQTIAQTPTDREVGLVPVRRFRKLACHPQYRCKGISTRLLQHVFNDLSDPQIPILPIYCDAQASVAAWFEKVDIGMERVGKTFKGTDNIEYIRMKRMLSAGPRVEVHED